VARSDTGRSLIGLALVLAILGGMAVFVVSKMGGSSGLNPEELPSVTLPHATSPASGDSPLGGYVNAAAGAACRSDYQAVTQAAATYAALHGRPPATMAAIESFFTSPITSPYFSISIDSGKPGTVEVATAGHPAVLGDTNCAYAG